MTSETEQTNDPETEVQNTPDDDVNVANDGADSESVDVASPDFQELTDDGEQPGASELVRFQNIKVTVSADLGRAEVPIETLMNLGEGSVLELNREIDSPVELVAQGVPLACGEVVVVDGCFAIRVTKVYEGNQPSAEA